MSMKDQLTSDMKDAMKSGDTERRDLIRYVLSAYKNAEIERKGDLREEDEIRLIQTQVKQRQDSIEQFRKGDRDDLADREVAQVRILEEYLPEQMSDEELDRFVKQGISEVGADGPTDMGKVMGFLKPRSEDRVDGRRLSAAVRDALAG